MEDALPVQIADGGEELVEVPQHRLLRHQLRPLPHDSPVEIASSNWLDRSKSL